MRRRTDVSITRRNLSLSEAVIDQLRNLRVAAESSSDSDIIRRALTTYEQFSDDLKEGISLQIQRKNGHVFLITPSALIGNDGGETVKVNLIFHEGSDKRMDNLRTATQAPSDSHVVRKALSLFDLLIREHSAGSRIQLHYPDGEIETVRFLGVPQRPIKPAPACSVKQLVA